MKPTVLLIACVAAWLFTFASAPDGAADLAVRPLSGQTAIGAPRAMARPRQPEVAQGPNLASRRHDGPGRRRGHRWDGRPVTDLRAEDFEILQDGRRQTDFDLRLRLGRRRRHTGRDGGWAPGDARDHPDDASQGGDAHATPRVGPSAGARPDLGRGHRRPVVSVASIAGRRRRCTVIDTQLAPADRVALVRTSRGSGRQQQFTADSTVLHQLVDGLRFNSRQFERDDWQVVADKQRLRDWPPVQDANAGERRRPPRTGRWPRRGRTRTTVSPSVRSVPAPSARSRPLSPACAPCPGARACCSSPTASR